MIFRIIALALLVLPAASAGARAEPEVLFDDGQAVSIAPFLEPLQPDIPRQTQSPTVDQPPAVDPRSFGLPVRTPSMTPGRVSRQRSQALAGKMGAAQPLFLIGADRWSLQWLQQNRARLAELRAVGMVVQAENAAEVAILRREAGDVELIVASGEEIASSLGIRHYPVLIAPPGLIVQ